MNRLEIKAIIDNFISSNFIVKSLLSSFPQAKVILEYIPECIEIVLSSDRGKEIVEEIKVKING